MEEEIKSLLEKNLEVSERSLQVLKKLERALRWERIFSAVKWALVIGFIIFGFIQLQPYILYWAEVFSNIAKGIDKINSIFPGR